MSAITIIDLSGYVFTCAVCEREFENVRSSRSFGIARYEDEVVPDGYQGEWGGAEVCERCYWIERGMHSAQPQAFITFSELRRVAKVEH